MRFKIDENLPFEVATFFRTEGYEAHTVAEQGARGFIDPRISEMCRDAGEVLVTMDMDFANLRSYPPAAYPGFLVLRSRVQDKAAVVALLRNNIPVLQKLNLCGHLTIVSDEQARHFSGE
ncbi:MAG: hypothetical protein FJY92_06590 [Candidatus Hydrogenedentes bacterium]|nr:hypothetical protein [Candidatus Hydrogenedentota bacterium]